MMESGSEPDSEQSWGRLSASKEQSSLEIWFLSDNQQNITAHAAFSIPSCPRFWS